MSQVAAGEEQISLEPKELWGLCDELRDDLLPRLGVAVKDHRDGTASWDKV